MMGRPVHRSDRRALVFNALAMKRVLLPLAISATLLALPSAASARIVELGKVRDPATPACPSSPCLALAKTTGYPVRSDSRRDIMVVPKSIKEGRVFGFSLTLGKPNTRQIDFFNQRTGGPATVRIAIIKPYRRTANRYRFVLNAQSEDFQVQPWFGQTVQLFFRERTLKVRAGYIVALTVPTWAPVLATGMTETNSWRASRGKPCADTTLSQPPQVTPGSVVQYFCNYRRERPLYTALIGVTP
jgi:hypothetical protein